MVRSKLYARVHASISRRYGKASKCENIECCYKNPKRYEWALKKGFDYSDNIEHYIQLCVSCHRRYDFTEIKRKNMSLAQRGIEKPLHTGVHHEKSIPIKRFDLKGSFIDEWPSINQCAKKTGIAKQNIIECLKGNIKQIKGFTFTK